MKKTLLFAFLLVIGSSLNAQFVYPVDRSLLEITNSPAKGWYSLDAVADSLSSAYYFGGKYTQDQWFIGQIAKYTITDTLVLAKDSLGLKAFSNASEIKGNIAVIYRGSASFVQKALYAQNAGAVAVILINNVLYTQNQRGPLVGGTVTDTPNNFTGSGMDVKIPVVMININDGKLISDAIRSGEKIVAYLGPKKVFKKDLAIDRKMLIAPTKRTRPKFLAYEGEVVDTLGLGIMNTGTDTVRYFGARVTIKQNATNKFIHRDSLVNLKTSLNPKDTVWYQFSNAFVNKADLDTGSYTVTYSLIVLDTVTQGGQLAYYEGTSDEFLQNNTISMDINITDSLYSPGRLDENVTMYSKAYKNVPYYTHFTKPSRTSADKYTEWGTCIHVKEPNGNRMILEGVNFVPVVPTGSTLKDRVVYVKVYKWDDKFESFYDKNFNYSNLLLLDVTDVTLKDSVNRATFQHTDFSYPIQVESDNRYFVCVTTKDTLMSLGFDYENVSMGPIRKKGISATTGKDLYSHGLYYYEPLFSNYIDVANASTKYSPIGFGLDWIPAMSLNVRRSTLSVEEKSVLESTFNVYPNPASTVVNVSFKLENNSNVDVTIADLTGKVVYSNKVNKTAGSNSFAIDTKGLNNGMYVVSVTTENGIATRRVSIDK